ncbi:MAG: hypothetical protein AAF702_09790 [Chloroflexota bacterium]
MAIISDFLPLVDNGFNLEVGKDIDRHFAFEFGNAAQLDQKLILQYFYESHQDASNLRLRFRVNGNDIRTMTLNGNSFSTMHEILQGNNFAQGRNTIEAKIVGGDGSVTLSDIVLWFRRNA